MERKEHLIATEDQVFEILATTSYLIVNKQLLEKFGPETTVLLSNLIDKYKYFKENEQLVDGCYFYLLNEEQMEQTGMNLYKVKTCKKILKDSELVKTTRIGNKEYYKLEASNILQHINSQTNIDQQPDEYQPSARRLSTANTNKNKAGDKEKVEKEKNYDYGAFLEMFPKDWKEHPKFKDSLERFVKHRRELHRPLTKQARTLSRNELTKTSVEIAVTALDLAVERGYIAPFMESAEKFHNRKGMTNQEIDTSISPKEIIDNYFNGTYGKTFFKYYKAAEKILTTHSNGSSVVLAKNMIRLRKWIKRKQTPRATENMSVPSPGALVQEYTKWLSEQNWLSVIEPGVYLEDSNVFKRFIKSSSATIGVDVFEGTADVHTFSE